MSNSDFSIVSLKCPGCGASLDVPENTATFTCTYCGTPVQIVREAAETTGTDKVAAELAIARLQKEYDHFPPPEIVRIEANGPKYSNTPDICHYIGAFCTFFSGLSLAIAWIWSKDGSYYKVLLIPAEVMGVLGFFLLYIGASKRKKYERETHAAYQKRDRLMEEVNGPIWMQHNAAKQAILDQIAAQKRIIEGA